MLGYGRRGAGLRIAGHRSVVGGQERDARRASRRATQLEDVGEVWRRTSTPLRGGCRFGDARRNRTRLGVSAGLHRAGRTGRGPGALTGDCWTVFRVDEVERGAHAMAASPDDRSPGVEPVTDDRSRWPVT